MTDSNSVKYIKLTCYKKKNHEKLIFNVSIINNITIILKKFQQWGLVMTQLKQGLEQRLRGTSEVNTAAVVVPSHLLDTAQVELPGFSDEEEFKFRFSSHGQQEQFPAISAQDNQHIQTGNNSSMKHWEPR